MLITEAFKQSVIGHPKNMQIYSSNSLSAGCLCSINPSFSLFSYIVFKLSAQVAKHRVNIQPLTGHPHRTDAPRSRLRF